MNTRIHYLYRDADNYKVQNECVILGEMTEEQEQRIIACLDEKEYFVPSRVGMPERKIRYGNGLGPSVVRVGAHRGDRAEAYTRNHRRRAGQALRRGE